MNVELVGEKLTYRCECLFDEWFVCIFVNSLRILKRTLTLTSHKTHISKLHWGLLFKHPSITHIWQLPFAKQQLIVARFKTSVNCCSTLFKLV